VNRRKKERKKERKEKKKQKEKKTEQCFFENLVVTPIRLAMTVISFVSEQIMTK
jgi:hypothetical protein